jgi:hypothetical protein
MRDAFLHAVAHALANRTTIGPGTVYLVCRELQRQFVDYPDFSKGNENPKYSRVAAYR